MKTRTTLTLDEVEKLLLRALGRWEQSAEFTWRVGKETGKPYEVEIEVEEPVDDQPSVDDPFGTH